jgi:nitrite reductase/ring-hydroxylating ferredoxin subunit
MKHGLFVCRDADLEEGKGLAVSLRALDGAVVELALFRSQGRVYALEDRCPHRGARLSTGPVYEPCKIACLDHGWSIDLRTGAVDVPDRGQVRTFPVTRVGESLYVHLDGVA